MPFNAPAHRAYLRKLAMYVATQAFTVNVGWVQEGSADMLAESQSGDIAVAILVAKVTADRISCGAVGNHSNKVTFGPLEKAKYQFTVGRPDDEVFGTEYDVLYPILAKVQKSIAKTGNPQYFLLDDKKIKFSQDVFIKRATVSILFVYSDQL